MTTLDQIAARSADEGLAVTGWFHPSAEDGAPPEARTLLLIGYAGPEMWESFQTSAEGRDGAPHGLDRWSTRIIGDLAKEFGAKALFPFGGPPYQPFIRWTYAGEPVHQSKLGMSIHPERGLWSGWRGALALRDHLDLPPVERSEHPCTPCPAPCRDACPVGAFTDAGYDTAACRSYLNSDQGGRCRSGGCLARRACPVGSALSHSPEQAAFHLEAFRVA
jgi:ferredoxin